MSHNYKKIGIFLFIFLIFMAGLITIQAKSYFTPVNPSDSTIREIEIPQNSSTAEVASILRNQGIIKNQEIFILYCRINGYDARLKAGLYNFRRNQSLAEIVDDLVAGRIVTDTVTIPEGLTLEDIGKVLENQGFCSQEQWKDALVGDYDYSFLKDIPQRENRLEGFLYPDTYRIRKGSTAEEIIDIMLKRFMQVWDEKFADKARSQNMTLYQVITVASMVEREALFNSERARIVGVMYNRLRAGMPLQVDATVLYSLGIHKERVTYKDLEVDSPYNTYRITGLPPGPIASPGASSISAVLSPEKNNYYYYVAMSNGYHYFSRTYAEHLRAKNKYR
ncbi:MAG: endolytic transglycosylase MltG [Chitinophagales bacterium]